MLTLSGYRLIEQIYDGTRTVVYRGVRSSDRKPIVVKLLKSEYPSFGELVQFRNQYAIAKNLSHPGIVRPIALERHRNGYALIMEDFGCISLSDYTRSTPFAIGEFLAIALSLTQTLEELYHNRIIHKDIKPDNILIHPVSKLVFLIDFSISSLLLRENKEIQNPNVLEGTLAYMSPEQTGRMNRGIDYRTDFYSLGVTLYELATGQLPFQSSDPMELVHSHIAKKPTPPSEIVPALPPVISDIIMKLMAKTPEERYQSAFGLKSDLENCLQQWKNTGSILPFALATRDLCDRFTIPEKLYGREAEVASLLAAFDRVSSGSSTFMLVAGFSGIGKTALVNEVHKPIVKSRGYFIKGKFDQFKRNIPFSALVQALRDLMQQLLAESPERVQQWKTRILEALGENGRIVIEVIPELELLIGAQPPVPDLDANAAQNRFNLLFQKFIQIFPTAEHPLVIFLDDLQWVDSASLKSIQLLTSETDSRYLLLIGAYRDNEVYPAHPLRVTLEEIRKTGAIVNQIELAPLERDSLNHLIANTLSCPAERAEPLTELVHQKTSGNPFFATQFLKSLHEESLISFDYTGGYWQCDISKVRALSLTDDVVEFMALQLKKLPASTQEAIKLAACIGNQFDLSTLAIVCEKSLSETAADLWKALQAGLILPIAEIYKFFTATAEEAIAEGDEEVSSILRDRLPAYKFLHDRVQQAAYFLIPENQKKATHLKIGQLLLSHTPAAEREDKIFDIVNQLNVGWELLENPSQRDELARLNLQAGRKAKASTAYAAAVRCFSVALALLPPDSWQRQYDFTLELYTAAAEAEYLNINFARSVELSEAAMRNAASLRDRVKVHELQMQINIAQLEMGKAVEIGLQVLESLGISLVPLTGEDSLTVEIPALADLDNLPIMTDPNKLAAMQILKLLCTPVFQAKPELFPQLILTMIHLCLEWGNSALSAFAYGFYGLLLVGFNQLDDGYQAGLIALKLLDKFNAKELKATVFNLFNSNNRSWKEHAKNSLPFLQEGVQSGLETGELEWGGYCAGNLSSYLFLTGSNLAATVQAQSIYIDLCQKIHQEIPTYFSQVWQQLALNFQGQAADILLLTGAGFDEGEIVPRLIAGKAGTVLFVFYVAKVILTYSFNASDRALENVEKAREYAGAAFGFVQVPVLNFYHSLALLDRYPEVKPSEQETCWQQVEKNQAELKFWAEHAPANNQHKYDLVAAEQARLLRKNWEASELYDRAIQAAKEQEYIHEEALASELAARFYLQWGKETIARAYLTDAYYAYAHWGAKAKVEHLEKHYPQLLEPIFTRQKISLPSEETISQMTKGTFSSTTTGASALLDVSSAIKASQALSGEIHLEQLLSKLMQVVMENAGAEKGAIAFADGSQLESVAVCVSSRDCQLQSLPLESSSQVPVSLLQYVSRTRQALVINCAEAETTFAADPYIQLHKPKSVSCVPLLNRGQLIGILYLENNLTAGAFTRDRLEFLNILTAQAAISIENARLYQKSQEYALQLKASLQQLQEAQIQLVQSEKMSALGQLVAGVAHEINNPVGFIAGNLSYAQEYIQSLIDHLQLYQQKLPEADEEISNHAAEIELDYLIEDLPQLISSMKEGTDRIRHISTSLRTFSRSDAAEKVSFNIHEGLDSTLLILKHRLKATAQHSAIAIVKEYGDLPPIACYPGQLNQVFVNVLANAIDALEGHGAPAKAHGKENQCSMPNAPCPTIWIRTEILPDENRAIIRIKDSGPGMPKEVKERVFDHLFTTKAAGKGTGLGLSISRQIVEEKHGGRLTCISEPGEGTEFAIALPI